MKTIVVKNSSLREGWWLLEVAAPALAPAVRAGQFVQVRIGEGDDPLLRRPFSIYDVLPAPGPTGERIQILYQIAGAGTRWMARLKENDGVDCLGPLGKPFPEFRPKAEDALFLVGGGIGVAPLYFYCREISQGMHGSHAMGSVRMLLGARRAALLIGKQAFAKLGVPIACATDDGSDGFHGSVVALLARELAAVQSRAGGRTMGIGCGPHGMNMALRNFVIGCAGDYAISSSLDFWISLENYMPCGFGACFGCVIPVPGEGAPRYRRVCVDGPAFPAQEIPAESSAR